MSTKEAQRFGIMQQVDKKILTLRAASEELCLSLSQTKKIRKRYRLEGPKGLISKHLGKISPNRTDPKIKDEVLEILKSEDFEDLRKGAKTKAFGHSGADLNVVPTFSKIAPITFYRGI